MGIRRGCSSEERGHSVRSAFLRSWVGRGSARAAAARPEEREEPPRVATRDPRDFPELPGRTSSTPRTATVAPKAAKMARGVQTGWLEWPVYLVRWEPRFQALDSTRPCRVATERTGSWRKAVEEEGQVTPRRAPASGRVGVQAVSVDAVARKERGEEVEEPR